MLKKIMIILCTIFVLPYFAFALPLKYYFKPTTLLFNTDIFKVERIGKIPRLKSKCIQLEEDRFVIKGFQSDFDDIVGRLDFKSSGYRDISVILTPENILNLQKSKKYYPDELKVLGEVAEYINKLNLGSWGILFPEITYRFHSDGKYECDFSPTNIIQDKQQLIFVIRGMFNPEVRGKSILLVSDSTGKNITHFVGPSYDIRSPEFIFNRYLLDCTGGRLLDISSGRQIVLFNDMDWVGVVVDDTNSKAILVYYSELDKYAGPWSAGAYDYLYESIALLSADGNVKMIAKFRKPASLLTTSGTRPEWLFGHHIRPIGWDENGAFYFELYNNYWRVTFK